MCFSIFKHFSQDERVRLNTFCCESIHRPMIRKCLGTKNCAQGTVGHLGARLLWRTMWKIKLLWINWEEKAPRIVAFLSLSVPVRLPLLSLSVSCPIFPLFHMTAPVTWLLHWNSLNHTYSLVWTVQRAGLTFTAAKHHLLPQILCRDWRDIKTTHCLFTRQAFFLSQ